MRPIIDQVDEFIEGFFDGSIISSLDIMAERSSKRLLAHMKNEDVNYIDYMSDKLRGELIPNYLKAEGEEKEKVGAAIFIGVMELRYIGVIKNNPDTMKETTYWKNRCLTVELQNKQLTDTVMALKAGSSGIG
jgi:hypothetical protein